MFMSNIDDYDIGQCLGKGGFASVFQARERDSNEDDMSLAIKIIDKSNFVAHDGAYLKFMNEYKIHSSIMHENVVLLHGFFEEKSSLFFAMELCPLGNMYRHLQDNGPLTISCATHVLKCLVSALVYLHSRNIIHRDLKLSNILIKRNHRQSGLLEVKLCDFGMSVELQDANEEHFTFCGTPNYVPPETLSQMSHSFPADVWSLGIIYYCTLLGYAPFQLHNPNGQDQSLDNAIDATFDRILHGEYSIPFSRSNHKQCTEITHCRDIAKNVGFSASMLKFLAASLHLNPASRWTAAQLASHHVFDEDMHKHLLDDNPQHKVEWFTVTTSNLSALFDCSARCHHTDIEEDCHTVITSVSTSGDTTVSDFTSIVSCTSVSSLVTSAPAHTVVRQFGMGHYVGGNYAGLGDVYETASNRTSPLYHCHTQSLHVGYDKKEEKESLHTDIQQHQPHPAVMVSLASHVVNANSAQPVPIPILPTNAPPTVATVVLSKDTASVPSAGVESVACGITVSTTIDEHAHASNKNCLDTGHCRTNNDVECCGSGCIIREDVLSNDHSHNDARNCVVFGIGTGEWGSNRRSKRRHDVAPVPMLHFPVQQFSPFCYINKAHKECVLISPVGDFMMCLRLPMSSRRKSVSNDDLVDGRREMFWRLCVRATTPLQVCVGMCDESMDAYLHHLFSRVPAANKSELLCPYPPVLPEGTLDHSQNIDLLFGDTLWRKQYSLKSKSSIPSKVMKVYLRLLKILETAKSRIPSQIVYVSDVDMKDLCGEAYESVGGSMIRKRVHTGGQPLDSKLCQATTEQEHAMCRFTLMSNTPIPDYSCIFSDDTTLTRRYTTTYERRDGDVCTPVVCVTNVCCGNSHKSYEWSTPVATINTQSSPVSSGGLTTMVVPAEVSGYVRCALMVYQKSMLYQQQAHRTRAGGQLYRTLSSDTSTRSTRTRGLIGSSSSDDSNANSPIMIHTISYAEIMSI